MSVGDDIAINAKQDVLNSLCQQKQRIKSTNVNDLAGKEMCKDE